MSSDQERTASYKQGNTTVRQTRKRAQEYAAQAAAAAAAATAQAAPAIAAPAGVPVVAAHYSPYPKRPMQICLIIDTTSNLKYFYDPQLRKEIENHVSLIVARATTCELATVLFYDYPPAGRYMVRTSPFVPIAKIHSGDERSGTYYASDQHSAGGNQYDGHAHSGHVSNNIYSLDIRRYLNNLDLENQEFSGGGTIDTIAHEALAAACQDLRWKESAPGTEYPVEKFCILVYAKGKDENYTSIYPGKCFGWTAYRIVSHMALSMGIKFSIFTALRNNKHQALFDAGRIDGIDEQNKHSMLYLRGFGPLYEYHAYATEYRAKMYYHYLQGQLISRSTTIVQKPGLNILVPSYYKGTEAKLVSDPSKLAFFPRVFSGKIYVNISDEVKEEVVILEVNCYCFAAGSDYEKYIDKFKESNLIDKWSKDWKLTGGKIIIKGNTAEVAHTDEQEAKRQRVGPGTHPIQKLRWDDSKPPKYPDVTSISLWKLSLKQQDDPRKPIIRYALQTEFVDNYKTWALDIDDERHLSIFALNHHAKLRQSLAVPLKDSLSDDDFPLLVAQTVPNSAAASSSPAIPGGIAPSTIMQGGQPTLVHQVAPPISKATQNHQAAAAAYAKAYQAAAVAAAAAARSATSPPLYQQQSPGFLSLLVGSPATGSLPEPASTALTAAALRQSQAYTLQMGGYPASNLDLPEVFRYMFANYYPQYYQYQYYYQQYYTYQQYAQYLYQMLAYNPQNGYLLVQLMTTLMNQQYQFQKK